LGLNELKANAIGGNKVLRIPMRFNEASA
jgi:hypothetical protein